MPVRMKKDLPVARLLRHLVRFLRHLIFFTKTRKTKRVDKSSEK